MLYLFSNEQNTDSDLGSNELYHFDTTPIEHDKGMHTHMSDEDGNENDTD